MQLALHLPMSSFACDCRHRLQFPVPCIRDALFLSQVPTQRDLQRKVHTLDHLLDLLLGSQLHRKTALLLPFHLRDQSDDCSPYGAP